jgi:hypothetical protein
LRNTTIIQCTVQINHVFLDGFAYYEEWQDVVKKADENAKVLLRHYGDNLKQRDDVCPLIRLDTNQTC